MTGKLKVAVLALLVVVLASSPLLAAEVYFSYQDPFAKKVYLAGSFNGWDSTKDPMVRNEEGIWELRLELAEGKYEYKFVVDGMWYHDLNAEEFVDDGFGGKNSVIVVGPSIADNLNTLALGGYIDVKMSQSLVKGEDDKWQTPDLGGQTWLKLSGKALDGKVDIFTEVGIEKNAFAINKDVRFQDFVPDHVLFNQARVTYLGEYADISYYYRGRSGSSRDFLGLWLDKDAPGEDKIGWERHGFGVESSWQDIEGRVIGLKRSADQIIYGEALWEPQADYGAGAGFVYNSKSNALFASGYERQLNGTVWGWYQPTEQIKLDGQVLVSHGGKIVYEDLEKVPFTFVMDEDGAGDGQIGQSGNYGDIAYAQLRGSFNNWAWDTAGDNNWDKYQEGYAYDLVKQADGTWKIDLELEPGEYEFKVRLFDQDKGILGDVWGPHGGGNAKFVVHGKQEPREETETGFAYFVRGAYTEDNYGATVTLKAVQPGVNNEVSNIGKNYLDLTTASWYQVLPVAKLTLNTKHSYSYDRKDKYEVMLKPGAEFEPDLEYVDSAKVWYEHYLLPADKNNKYGTEIKVTYAGFVLENTFTVDSGKQWALQNKLKGTIPTVDAETELELGLKNNFWSLKGKVNKEILPDVKLAVNGEYNKNKLIDAGLGLNWFFPNSISNDLRVYLDYNYKSEIKDSTRITTNHKVVLGVKGDF